MPRHITESDTQTLTENFRGQLTIGRCRALGGGSTSGEKVAGRQINLAKEITRSARQGGEQHAQGSPIQAPAIAGAWNSSLDAGALPAKAAPGLKIFVLHEDTLTGVRATAVLGRLSEGLGEEPVIQNEIWKFDSLCQPVLYEQALRQAQSADMIIVSAGGQQPLPRHIAELLSEAVACKPYAPGALVALLDMDPRNCRPTAPLYGELRRLAENAGVDFFCNLGDSPWLPGDHRVSAAGEAIGCR